MTSLNLDENKDPLEHSTVSSVTIGDETRRDFASSNDFDVVVNDGFHSVLRHLSLVGRDKEQEILRAVWSRVSSILNQEESHSAIVNVSGESGVGKSFLVEKTLRGNVFDSGGIFVSGKFDQLSFSTSGCNDSFTAVTSMFNDLYDFLFCNADIERQRLGDTIRKDIPDHDWELLIESVVASSCGRPSATSVNAYHRFMCVGDDRNPNIKESSVDSFTRLKQACRAFLVAVAKRRSLLLFFDDVQWADPDSVELMDYLVNQTSTSSIMFVLSYRNEDGLVYPLVSRKDNSRSEDTTELRLRNFSLSQVTDMFREQEIDEHDVATVGAIVFEKTQGNPFFITQFLEQLRIEGLLTVSEDNQNQWEWSNIQNMARIDVASGVLQCIDTRIHQINAKLRSVLVFAAHMGFTFRRDLLQTVVEPMAGNSSSKLVDGALKNGENKALIVSGKDGNSFCFMHDRVQQCLYEMVSEGTPKEMTHLNIGRRLRDSPFIREHSVLILAVHSMNTGRMHIAEGSEKLSLVEWNRRASVYAARKSSFSAAAHFLRMSLALLDEKTMWKERYELTLDLHVALARVSCSCGGLEEIHRLVQAVSSHARTVLDKSPLLEARVTAFSLQGNPDGLVVAHEALEELGESIDRKPSLARLLVRLLRTRSIVRRKTNEQLRGLPIMSNRKKMAVQKILYKMVVICFMTGNELMVLLLMDKMLRISLRYGRSLSTPASVAGFGMVESVVFKNYSEGNRLGDLAMEMLEEPDMREASAVTICIAHNVVLQWRDPLRSCIDPLYRGFVEGIKSGETYNAIANLGCVVGNTFNSGMPLAVAERKMRSYCARMSEFSESNTVMLWTRAFHQAALNCLGQCSDPLELNGEVMQENDVFLNNDESRDGTAVATCQLLKFELACHYRKLDKAVEFLRPLEPEEGSNKDVAGNFVPLKFFTCLTYLDLAYRKVGRKRRKLVQKSKKALKTLQDLSSKGCCRAEVVCALLEAEHHTMQKGKADMAMYDLAIATFYNEGFLQYAAISAERAGLALRRTYHEYDDNIMKYFRQGLDLNIEWEADGKVEWYKKRYLPDSRRVDIPFSVNIPESE